MYTFACNCSYQLAYTHHFPQPSNGAIHELSGKACCMAIARSLYLLRLGARVDTVVVLIRLPARYSILHATRKTAL